MNENTENIISSESGDSQSILDSQEDLSANDEFDQEYSESELVVLQRIDSTLTHIDSTVQYGVSLMIIFMLILILHYIYKFFRMFF